MIAAFWLRKQQHQQLSAQWRENLSKQHAIILSVCCATTQYSQCFVRPSSRSMAAAHDKRTDDWAKIRAERVTRVDCPHKGVRSGSDMPAPSTSLTKNAKDEEARSVLPKGSAIQQNITKLASIATRSTAAQTMMNPVT